MHVHKGQVFCRSSCAIGVEGVEGVEGVLPLASPFCLLQVPGVMGQLLHHHARKCENLLTTICLLHKVFGKFGQFISTVALLSLTSWQAAHWEITVFPVFASVLGGRKTGKGVMHCSNTHITIALAPGWWLVLLQHWLTCKAQHILIS